MHLQSVLWLLLPFILAVEMRTVQGEGSVSLFSDEGNTATRRRKGSPGVGYSWRKYTKICKKYPIWKLKRSRRMRRKCRNRWRRYNYRKRRARKRKRNRRKNKYYMRFFG